MTDSAAALIAAARLSRTPLAALPSDLAPRDLPEGLRLQEMVHRILAKDVGPRVGWKIGCTSAVMQQYLHVPHPCSGGVFEAGVHASGATLRRADYVRVGVECEIGVRLGRDLTASAEPYSAAGIADAIEAYLPAIEIVDDRYADWRTLGVPTLTADDFFAAGCVLGSPVPVAQAPDVAAVVGRAIIDGGEAGRGTGADVLGHPHHALAWLANHRAEQGRGLRAGEIVLTGSITQVVWLQPGDTDVVMDLEGLGQVVVRFE